MLLIFFSFHPQLLKLGQKVFGTKLFNFIIRSTFYNQFVAGEDEVAIKPVLDQLRSFGVKSILDYSAEEDISGKQNEDTAKATTKSPSDTKDETGKKYGSVDVVLKQHTQKPVARTYFYMNEANCEKNMDIFLRCIDAVAGATNHTGFAAIKLTALGRPGECFRAKCFHPN